MKAIPFLLLIACYTTASKAQNAGQANNMEERVQHLEGRVAKVEQQVAQAGQTPEAQKMSKVARRHMADERAKFKAEDIEKAEQLYVKASANLRSDESKALLDELVSSYPQLNRAGCAQLYRAQQESGEEKERLLKDCIQRFPDCYYGDGAQVGPLAMLQLGHHYRETGKKDAAKAIFSRIRKEYPEAVNHRGGLLINEIN